MNMTIDQLRELKDVLDQMKKENEIWLDDKELFADKKPEREDQ